MHRNIDIVQDHSGNDPDWIEIYNPGNNEIDLSNYFLSNDFDDLITWKMPDICLGPDSFLLIYADKKDYITDQEIHTNFNLGPKDSLYLTSIDCQIVDEYKGSSYPGHHSIGKLVPQDTTWYEFRIVSPLKMNQRDHLEHKINFSHPGGQYDSAFQLSLTTQDLAIEIRYTNDCTSPNQKSKAFINPIHIQDRSNEPNIISTKIADLTRWTTTELVPKMTIIQAQSFNNGKAVSDIYTHSFLIENDHDLPIISIVGNPIELYSNEHGIMVSQKLKLQGKDYYLANYTKDIRISGNFEFFSMNGSANYPIQIEIHGHSSRNSIQKSFKIISDSNLGYKKMDFPFFPKRKRKDYNRLLLKTPFASHSKSLLNSYVANKLLDQWSIDLLSSAIRPVVAYVNGEYYGVFYMRESIDDYFIGYYSGVPKSELDYLNHRIDQEKYLEYGSYYRMEETIKFFQQTDPSSTNYPSLISSYVDLDSFFDYYIFQIIIQNMDWPQANINFYSSHTDGIWYPIVWDLDFTFRKEKHSHIDQLISGDDSSEIPINEIIIQHLLMNDTFKDKFRSRVQNIIDTIIIDDWLDLIDHCATTISPEMELFFLRFHSRQENYFTWEKDIEQLKEFAKTRISEIQEEIDQLCNK